MRFVRNICAGMSILALAFPAFAAQLLQNDGFFTGQNAVFQSGFVAGEEGAVRLSPPGPFPMQVTEVQLLFGSAASSQTVTLNIYDDSAGSTAPGTLLYTGDWLLTGSTTAFSSIDLSGESVFVSDDFRVSIQFQHSGQPSIARDDDGNINASLNFINADGLGWFQSSMFGLTGDWIIRAVVDDATNAYTIGGNVSGLDGTMTLLNNGTDPLLVASDGPFAFSAQVADGNPYDVTIQSSPLEQQCVVMNGSGTVSGANVTDVSILCSDIAPPPEELKNDGFFSGQTVSFQGGFAAGEMAASRFTPSGNVDLLGVRFLYGGAPGNATVRVHVWDDAAGTSTPGTALYTGDHDILASDLLLQEIDLSGEGIQVSADFRVGIELLNAGLPSVARDDDGDINVGRNWVFSPPSTWTDASSLGVLGDWIIRAVTTSNQSPTPAILSIDDVGNDQGRQVRIEFSGSSQDASGAGQPVLQYEAFRRIDPLPSGIVPMAEDVLKLDGWEFVGAVPAHGESVYNMVAPTLADSTLANGMHWSTFFVRAATAVPATFYDSPPDSGYSLDNLAPAPPQSFALNGNFLEWDTAPEADFSYFNVYSSSNPELDGSAALLTQTTATSFDVGAQSASYYHLTAVDFSGNEGNAATTLGQATATIPIPKNGITLQVVPNPFNPATTVHFTVPRDGRVSMHVYDLRGRKVEVLMEDVHHTAGSHQYIYRSELASGTYFLRVTSGRYAETVKLSLVR